MTYNSYKFGRVVATVCTCDLHPTRWRHGGPIGHPSWRPAKM